MPGSGGGRGGFAGLDCGGAICGTTGLPDSYCASRVLWNLSCVRPPRLPYCTSDVCLVVLYHTCRGFCDLFPRRFLVCI